MAGQDHIGHGSQTWFAYMRELSHKAPDVCSFVFSFDKVLQARYQPEITASLLSELRQSKVVGAPPAFGRNQDSGGQSARVRVAFTGREQTSDSQVELR